MKEYPNLSLKTKEAPANLVEIDDSLIYRVTESHDALYIDGSRAIKSRLSGEFRGKGFYLNANFDWIIGHDKAGALCLIPIKKGAK